MGDYNINLLHTDDNHTSKFISSLLTYTFHSHISKPTRISSTSQSLIDNIFSNTLNKKNTNGILYYDISDHLPIFTISDDPIFKQNSKATHQTYYRKESKHNIELLNLDLIQEEWNEVINESNVDLAYENFVDKFMYYYNKNIPIVKNKKHKKSKQPWITKGILRSIFMRNKLYKQALKGQCESKMKKYKQYRNKLTSLIRLSRKLHFLRTALRCIQLLRTLKLLLES